MDDIDTDTDNTDEAPYYGNRECPCCNRAYSLDEDGDTPDTDWHETVSGDYVCLRCSDWFFTYSGIQAALIPSENAVCINDLDDYCTQSYAERHYWQDDIGEWYSEPQDNGLTLYDYGTNVLDLCAWDRLAARNGALLFGVELEMEPKDGADQEDVAEALGGRLNAKYILKEDGSLTDGVELVTVPLTLDGHRAAFNWQDTLRPVARKAKSGRGTTHCGMHVHVNKAALSAFTIGKMLVFLNSSRMEPLVTTIAQRASNGYCSRSYKKITDGKYNGDNRYDIANVGPRTVEFRLFRGNLRPERVLKNLEFCHAVVSYCRDASMQTLENPEEFSRWLLKRRGEYPELVKFLAGAKTSYFTGLIRPRKGESATATEEI